LERTGDTVKATEARANYLRANLAPD